MITESLRIISTKGDLMNYFYDKLTDLDYDDLVKSYVSNLMTDFAYTRGNELISVIYNESLERVRIQELFNKEDFSKLRDMGDAFLWLCGFFPEQVIDKNRNRPRFMLTLKDYVLYGRTAYNLASVLREGKELPISEISRNFEWVVNSIFNIRDKINPNLKYFLHEETISEIEKVINFGKPMFSPEKDSSLIIN